MTIRPNSIEASDIAHVLHPYTNAEAHGRQGPVMIERGEGIYVFDGDGNRYIEALSGLFCASLGFSERRLVEAATEQMNKLPFYHTFGHKSNTPSVELADRLIKLSPVPMSKVFFANSGSEANDTAIKLVWYYFNSIGQPAKKKIISRQRAYHGVTIATASLTGLPYNHRSFDLPIDRVVHTMCPSFYRSGLPGETEAEFATRCANALEDLILKEGPETVAAFIAEPIQVSGGCVVPPATYFEKVQAVLRKYDILLIADEVICGFGRTGNMFGCETFGLVPDIISMAKQLSAAYLPISAVMISDRIYQGVEAESGRIGTFGHGFTYGGHPVPAAVALETLIIYEERDIVGHVRALEPHFADHMRRLANHPLVGEARSKGLVGALEFVKDKATREGFDPARGVAAFIGSRAHAHGVITRATGDFFHICPPLIITEPELDDMFRRIESALNDTWAWVTAR